MDGEVWFDSQKSINLSPQKRRVGFMFQNYALFEHMSVLENLLFAQEPKILLLDEPLSALDALTRSRLQDELKKTHDIFKLTTMMVSHDRSEVFKLSDQVLWLKEGKIFNQGSPRKVFLSQHSTSKFAFEGEVLDCEKRDSIYVATIGIGNTIVEVVLNKSEAIHLKIGTSVSVSTKAFAPIVKIMP